MIENDCVWNVGGIYKNAAVTHGKRSSLGYDHDSRQNCTLTQLGVWCCSGYFPEGLRILDTPRARAIKAALAKTGMK